METDKYKFKVEGDAVAGDAVVELPNNLINDKKIEKETESDIITNPEIYDSPEPNDGPGMFMPSLTPNVTREN